MICLELLLRILQPLPVMIFSETHRLTMPPLLPPETIYLEHLLQTILRLLLGMICLDRLQQEILLQPVAMIFLVAQHRVVAFLQETICSEHRLRAIQLLLETTFLELLLAIRQPTQVVTIFSTQHQPLPQFPKN
jgi:hypothetical protein